MSPLNPFPTPIPPPPPPWETSFMDDHSAFSCLLLSKTFPAFFCHWTFFIYYLTKLHVVLQEISTFMAPLEVIYRGVLSIGQVQLDLLKSVNLQYNTLGPLEDGTTNPQPSVWCSKFNFFSWFLAKSFARILLIYFLIFVTKLQK